MILPGAQRAQGRFETPWFRSRQRQLAQYFFAAPISAN